DLIVTTHCHHDHVGALAEMMSATGARTAAGTADAKEITERIDLPLAHGDVLEFGAQRVEIIHLRGHTPGSIAVLWRGGDEGDHLFTGDSLFPGGVGNTQQDPERFAQLLDDVEQRIFDRLGDDTWVYPGHGDDTTLGAERPSLAAWRARGWWPSTGHRRTASSVAAPPGTPSARSGLMAKGSPRSSAAGSPRTPRAGGSAMRRPGTRPCSRPV